MSAPPVETIRINETGKRNLNKLKRRTKIQNWNILCRWALCISLADESSPQKINKGDWSNVEMSWATFGGNDADLYTALVHARCVADGFELEGSEVAEQFRLHLHRGLTKLAGMEDTKSLAGLLKQVLT
tara:strand:+ start:1434 stop:1820 length:387 start_codon:yes stop_codon:yes gene_type:complete